MSIPTMQSGEVGVVFRFYLQENGSPFDVSGADKVNFFIEGNGTRAMLIEDGTNGQVSYTTVSGDFTDGSHEAQVQVLYNAPLKDLRCPKFLIAVSPAVRT